MKQEEITTLHKAVEDLLTSGHLYTALTRIATEAKAAGAWDIARTTASKIENYDYLLEYFKRGAKDPLRDELRSTLTVEAFSLNDRLADSLMTETSKLVYYSWKSRQAEWAKELDTSHLLQTLQTKLSTYDMADSISEEEEHEADKLAEKIFYTIWTNYPYTAGDLLITRQLITTECVRSYRREMFLSALTLALMQWYDPQKMSLLLDCIDPPMPDGVRARAWVGLALLLFVQPVRTHYDTMLHQRLGALRERYLAPDGTSPLLTVQLQLYQSQEAESVKQHIKKEITPELHRLVNEILNNPPEGKTNKRPGDEPPFDTFNPEWEERLTKAGLTEKMQEIDSLQAEGTDVIYNTFTSMTRIPFFKTMSNWFVPYDLRFDVMAQHYRHDPSLHTLAKTLEKLPHMCSSDRYAIFFLYTELPAAQRKAFAKYLSRNQAAAEEDRPVAKPRETFPADLARYYLHDLYRFFAHYAHGQDFRNPFNMPLHLFSKKAVGDWFCEPAALRLAARYLFRKRRFDDATAVLKQLYTKEGADESDWQQLAYASDHQASPDDAQTENILIGCSHRWPQSVWTMQYLAYFLMQRHRYDEARPVLNRALEAFPDDQKTLIMLAQCLMKLGHHSEALPLLFKADIQKEGSPQVEQAIAWCSLMTDKLPQAEKYALKAVHHRDAAQNWLNAGHIALRRGLLDEAVNRYMRCFRTAEGWSLEDYFRNMAQDTRSLSQAGLDLTVVKMVQELVAQKYALPQ